MKNEDEEAPISQLLLGQISKVRSVLKFQQISKLILLFKFGEDFDQKKQLLCFFWVMVYIISCGHILNLCKGHLYVFTVKKANIQRLSFLLSIKEVFLMIYYYIVCNRQTGKTFLLLEYFLFKYIKLSIL